MQQSISEKMPWMLPWWKPYGKDGLSVLVYLVVAHILAAAAIISLFVYGFPEWKVVLTTTFFVFYGSLSTTLGYHRGLAHGAVKLHPYLEQFFIFGAVFNGSGSPKTWVPNHRCHHAKADTVDDVSSPRHGGFWWAHLRWLYQWEPSDLKTWAPDIMNQPKYMGWTKWQPLLIILSLGFGYFIGGWVGIFWIGGWRMVFCLHGQCFVNSLLHLKPGLLEGVDSSQNIGWLGPLQTTAWGENWHGNHHEAPAAANFGRSRWQIDIAWYVILWLKKRGLAWNVNIYKDGQVRRLA